MDDPSSVSELSSVRPATLKRINMRRFLEEIRRHGPSTRAELSRMTGVAAPTSSNIIADLLDLGYLEEAQGRAPSKGRPGKVFRLARQTAYVVGAAIDVERCVVAPAGLEGIAFNKHSFETPRDYGELIDRIAHQVRQIQRERSGECLGIGLSLPGLVEERSGRVVFSPNLHFTDDHRPGADLEAKLGVSVVCTQEEHALCLAEQIYGQARNLSDFIALDLTSGMGMGVVSGGRFVSGKDGFAGEIGHITVEPNGQKCGCGNYGCLETVATDSSFLAAVRQRLGRRIEFEEIAREVAAETLDVSAELDSTFRYLSIGLATLVNIFNPEAIALYGQVLTLRPDAIQDLTDRMRERALRPSSQRVRLLPAQADKLSGALAGMLDQVFAAVGPKLAYGED